MDWKTVLAYSTELVDQELRVRHDEGEGTKPIRGIAPHCRFVLDILHDEPPEMVWAVCTTHRPGYPGAEIVLESLNEFNMNLCFQQRWSLTKGRDSHHLRAGLRNQPEGCLTRLERHRAKAVFSCCVQQNSTRRAEKNFTLLSLPSQGCSIQSDCFYSNRAK